MSKKANILYTLITCGITLLPMLAGVILWNQLPDQLSLQHITGQAFGNYGPKWVVVFLIPVIFCVAQLLLSRSLGSAGEKSRERIGGAIWIYYIICPALAIFSGVMTYGTALGWF